MIGRAIGNYEISHQIGRGGGPGNNCEPLADGTFVASLADEESSDPIALILNFAPQLDQ
jgi:hypothetical protein